MSCVPSPYKICTTGGDCVFVSGLFRETTNFRVKLGVKKRKFVSNRHKYLCFCVFTNAPFCPIVRPKKTTPTQLRLEEKGRETRDEGGCDSLPAHEQNRNQD